jgi:hypothetical protein
MTPAQLSKYLIFAINNNLPVLIKGKPGIGKSDIIEQATAAAGAKLIISHPVVSDPTDFKGMPAINKEGTKAHFLPFNDLNDLINATEPTVFFLDDLGQAAPSVQAACMQLILARRINGFPVSKYVTFLAATNRKEDKAAVSGLLEPVKSRFASIVELEVTTDDWCKWALNNNMPTELISFIRFRPDLLDNFEPTKDITNSPSPRTVANVGRQQIAGLPPSLHYEVFKGAAGKGFATEYTAFLELFKDLPNIDQIILNPANAPIPTQPGTRFAVSGMIAAKMTDQTILPLCEYLKRLPAEISVSCMKDATTRKPEIMQTRAFIQWTSDNNEVFM